MVKPSPFWRCGIKRKLATIEDGRVCYRIRASNTHDLLHEAVAPHGGNAPKKTPIKSIVPRLGWTTCAMELMDQSLCQMLDHLV